MSQMADYTNTATVFSDSEDTNPDNDSDNDDITVTTSADVSGAKD